MTIIKCEMCDNDIELGIIVSFEPVCANCVKGALNEMKELLDDKL